MCMYIMYDICTMCRMIVHSSLTIVVQAQFFSKLNLHLFQDPSRPLCGHFPDLSVVASHTWELTCCTVQQVTSPFATLLPVSLSLDIVSLYLQEYIITDISFLIITSCVLKRNWLLYSGGKDNIILDYIYAIFQVWKWRLPPHPNGEYVNM